MTSCLDNRPDPDSLLKNITVSEERKSRGCLKIFLGMAPGVGKTYAMLKAAHRLKSKGIDLVIGIVETHGRKEIEELQDGLEKLPRKDFEYKGTKLDALDLEALYVRNPKVVLVDELAHTNAPGSRNGKRFLDIEEVLNRGIDVFTTVNVQHLESRSESVREITGVEIRETVPDSFLDLADEITVIDIAPEELIARLEEGLIYGKDRGQLAKSHFFKKGNLTALRELTLRVAAERVDKDLRTYRQINNIKEVWKSGHRLLVGIFASPYGENLVRATKRLAGTLGATWIGLYVETERDLTDAEKTLLVKNIDLVRELGGELITTKADDPVSGILRVAQRENVTQIIVGKSGGTWLENLLSGGGIATRLQRSHVDIDIYSISTAKNRLFHLEKKRFPALREAFDSFDELGWVALAFVISWLLAASLKPFVGYIAVGFIFLLTVSIGGLFFSRTSVFILAVLFSAVYDFFFIPTANNFAVHRPEDFAILIMFFATAAIVGQLTSRLKKKEEAIGTREERAQTLYHLTKELLKAKGIQEILDIGSKFVEEVFHLEALIMTKNAEKTLSSGSFTEVLHNAKENAVAHWVLQNGRHAGKFTQTLSNRLGYYLPLTGKAGTIGILALKVSELKNFTPEQITLLENFANHLVSSLDREIFHSKSKDIQLYEETQKLYKTLLECVSHELKTPLVTIKGCSSAILDPQINSHENLVHDLAREVLLGSDRLQRIVDNLLDMSRIESGMLNPKVISYSVGDLIDGAIHKISSELTQRKFSLTHVEKYLAVHCDPQLTEQALINLLLNAHMYSPMDKPIEIMTSKSGNYVRIHVRDFGAGLDLKDIPKIFTKFYRAHPKKTGGIGLGLVIVKNIVELQGGRILGENHPEGGAIFNMVLPSGEENA